MNNNWIKSSLETKTIKRSGWVKTEHEFWLDCMGLMETGWIIFAGLERFKRCRYGYPGTEER